VGTGKSQDMSITPEALEPEFTLTTAATRLDFLSRRDSGASALNVVHEDDEDHWNAMKGLDTSLDTYEALELLALGEVISRKAHDSRLIGMRAALRGGAGWEQIAEALGTTPAAAYDSFNESVVRQLDADDAAAARELAGSRPGR
jgi:hypothetical protein